MRVHHVRLVCQTVAAAVNTHTYADNELSAIVVHVVVGDECDCSALPFIVTGPITRLASASNVKRCSKEGGEQSATNSANSL